MKTRLAAVTAVLLLALTGCAGTPDSSGDDRTAPAASESPAAAPATVEPTTTEEVDVEKYFLESGFVAQIDLSDEDKLAAGYYACEQVEAGNLEVVAIEGLEADLNTVFVADSTAILCPDLVDVYAAYRASMSG